MRVLPRPTLSAGYIIRWHVVRRWLPLLAERDRPTRLLDVGCGTGDYVREMARRFPGAVLIVGIDEDLPASLDQGPPAGPSSPDRVRLLRAGFPAAEVASLGPFDAVLCVDVLEHVRDHEGFVEALARVTRPGAMLLLHVPAAAQWHPLASVRRRVERDLEEEAGPHVREGYTPEDLGALVRHAGWEPVRWRRTFGVIAALWWDVEFALACRRLHLLRALLLPVTIAVAFLESLPLPRGTGNGVLLLARRRA